MLEGGDASNTYNCHGFAWHMDEGGNNVWIGYSYAGSEEIYWDDGSYVECDVNDPEVKKVSYFGDHSAITTDVSGVFISKWQIGPLLEHSYNYCVFYNNDNFTYYKPAQIQGAAFTANPTIISAGESVQFTNLSPSAFTSFNWSFPGGTPGSSTQQNPIVVYNNPGTYDVTLEAIKGNCSKTETKTGYIYVDNTFTANFTASTTTVMQGNSIIFTNTSTGGNPPIHWQ